MWRAGSGAPQQSRFAQLKVWAAHRWRKQDRPKRVAKWLLIQWPERESEPTQYWLAQLGPGLPGLRRLVRMAHARWRIEVDHRELKEELGPDHFEGRHSLGWHHHVTLAYGFLRFEQARLKETPGATLPPARRKLRRILIRLSAFVLGATCDFPNWTALN
jgi:SRSO17 transposase